MEFQIVKIGSKKGKSIYSWYIVTNIGDIIAESTREYDSFMDCSDDIDYIAANSFSATLRDLTGEPAILPDIREDE